MCCSISSLFHNSERETPSQIPLSVVVQRNQMADEPIPTRWSFQDFKSYYDAKFGRKKILENGENADKAISNGSSLGITSNGNTDGLTQTNVLVFVLAATNLPWELGAAMLSCLEKRILEPLPEPEARTAMFEELLPPQPGEEQTPYDLLVQRTEGYSSSDIQLLCKEAAMQPLRRLMSQLEQMQEVVPKEELPKVGPIRPDDIETALKNTRPSAYLHARKYEKFNADYGSQILQ